MQDKKTISDEIFYKYSGNEIYTLGRIKYIYENKNSYKILVDSADNSLVRPGEKMYWHKYSIDVFKNDRNAKAALAFDAIEAGLFKQYDTVVIKARLNRKLKKSTRTAYILKEMSIFNYDEMKKDGNKFPWEIDD